MKLHERLKELRKHTGWSQEAFAMDIGISTPGYIKLENGQRLASEKMIGKIVTAYANAKGLKAKQAAHLTDELLTLCALGSTSAFIRKIAEVYVKSKSRG